MLDPDRRRLSPWQVLLLGLGRAARCALVGAFLLVPLAKVVRRRRRRRTTSWSGVYVNGWQEVLDAARDRGTPVPEVWSRLAQASALGAGSTWPAGRTRRCSPLARATTRRTVASAARRGEFGSSGTRATRSATTCCGSPAYDVGGGLGSTPPRSSPRGRGAAPTAQSRRPACATKIAVPGVSSPRARDHPPQTRSCCSGHSGSTRSESTKSLELSRRTQSPSVRWCST